MLFKRLNVGAYKKQCLRSAWKAKRKELCIQGSQPPATVKPKTKYSKATKRANLHRCYRSEHALRLPWNHITLNSTPVGDMENYLRSSIRRSRRQRVRFALLNRPHYWEPHLPNPLTFGESVVDVINAAEKALAMRLIGPYVWWEQLWAQATKSVDIVPSQTLVKLLQLKYKSNYRSTSFLRAVVREISECYQELSLEAIAEIIMVYAHFGCCSKQLNHFLALRTQQFVKHMVLTYQRSAEAVDADETSKALALANTSLNASGCEGADPTQLTVILKAFGRLGANPVKLVQLSADLFIYCRLIKDLSSVLDGIGTLMVYHRHVLSKRRIDGVTMQAQLLTRVLAEAPPVIEDAPAFWFRWSQRWRSTENGSAQKRYIVTRVANPIPCSIICPFVYHIVDTAMRRRIVAHPEIRSTFMFYVYSAFLSEVFKPALTLTAANSEAKKFIVSEGAEDYSLPYTNLSGPDTLKESTATAFAKRNQASKFNSASLCTRRRRNAFMTGESRRSKQVPQHKKRDYNKPSMPFQVSTEAESPAFPKLRIPFSSVQKVERYNYPTRHDHHAKTHRFLTPHAFWKPLPQHLVKFQATEQHTRVKLLQDKLIPSVECLLAVWRYQAMSAIQTNLLDSGSNALQNHDCSAKVAVNKLRGALRCSTNDATLSALYYRGISSVKPTDYEEHLLAKISSAAVHLGLEPVSPKGLCLLLQVVAFRHVAESDDITSEDPDVRRFSTNMEILRDMLIYNIARKWSLFSPVEMYHCALAFHVLAVKNYHLESLIQASWNAIQACKHKLERERSLVMVQVARYT